MSSIGQRIARAAGVPSTTITVPRHLPVIAFSPESDTDSLANVLERMVGLAFDIVVVNEDGRTEHFVGVEILLVDSREGGEGVVVRSHVSQDSETYGLDLDKIVSITYC